jgi:putative FmdB family regulatory protein
MPNYTFRCSSCGLRFEKSLKLDDNHNISCVSCRSDQTSKMPPKGVAHSFKESTKIPKEVDLKVGEDAEKRWLEIEERNKKKETIRKEHGTQRLERGPDGEYRPFSFTKDGETVSQEEGVNLRKEMLNQYSEIKKDSESVKIKVDE